MNYSSTSSPPASQRPGPPPSPPPGLLSSGSRAGDLVYISLDGRMVHYPASEPWSADGVPDLDLCQLRILLITALGEVEDGLDSRGLLARVTPPPGVKP